MPETLDFPYPIPNLEKTLREEHYGNFRKQNEY